MVEGLIARSLTKETDLAMLVETRSESIVAFLVGMVDVRRLICFGSQILYSPLLDINLELQTIFRYCVSKRSKNVGLE